MSELEHLRAEVQSRNLKLVSLASVNKSMLNDRDKLKQVTDERDSFKAQLESISDQIKELKGLDKQAMDHLLT